jgi:cellobiose transport system substrate-binding protein
MTWTRTRAVSALALGTASAILLSACGSSPEASVGPSHAPVTVSVGFYGDFGLTKLEAKYEKSHPWVDLQLNSGDYAPQHDLLQQALETGSGAYTVMAIDEGYLSRFVPQADSFVNLLDLGAADSKAKFPEWAWAEAANTDGTKLIALPNSLYGLAVCYRSDLFAAAGLESDRAAVSSTISGSWDNFISEGQKYVAATGKPFIDDAKTVLDPPTTTPTSSSTWRTSSPRSTSRPASSAPTSPRMSPATHPSGTRGFRTASSRRSSAPNGCSG